MERAFVAVVAFASFTCAVKLNVPALVGVPEITPVVVFSFSPPGRLPEAIDQV